LLPVEPERIGDTVLVRRPLHLHAYRLHRVFRIEVRGDVWQSSHTLTQSESLWRIARAAYGGAESWLQLYKANEDKLGGQPDTLLPGMILIISPPKNW
jgi:nucleoid-associated protein YgaU